MRFAIFLARAYSGYLFRQRFPAAGCRVQIANFMLMRFAIFLARAFSRHRLYHTSCGVFFLIEENSLKAGDTFKGFFPYTALPGCKHHLMGTRFLVHRKNQPARKPPGFPYPPPRAPAPTAVFYPGFSPRPGRPPQGPRWRSISASASQPPGRSPYTWRSARG